MLSEYGYCMFHVNALRVIFMLEKKLKLFYYNNALFLVVEINAPVICILNHWKNDPAL